MDEGKGLRGAGTFLLLSTIEAGLSHHTHPSLPSSLLLPQAAFDADGNPKPKFLATFPYPYMNGRLHLGHAYSMTKAVREGGSKGGREGGLV